MLHAERVSVFNRILLLFGKADRKLLKSWQTGRFVKYALSGDGVGPIQGPLDAAGADEEIVVKE